MKELEYPFDAHFILSRKKRLRRELLESGQKFVDKRIAILGGSTTAEIKNVLELFLLNYGIRPSFYECGFGQYYEAAVFPNKELLEFHPDIFYIHTTRRNVSFYPSLTDDKERIDEMAAEEYKKFEEIWTRLRQVYGCPVIQNNFEMPLYRLLGNRDISDIHGAANFLERLNGKFYEYAQNHDSFYICDIAYLAADFGLKEWGDPFYYYLYKYALNMEAIPSLSFQVANIIKSIFGKNKKGFVLDLDNTLWGGVVGEDGVDHLSLGPGDANGEAYQEFQRYIKAQKQLGILLNVASKNDYENAVSGLNHPDSLLKPEDFMVIKANWEPKDQSVGEIAEELGILPESLVFVDDNPAERHLVSRRFPGIQSPDVGEIHQAIVRLDRSGYFEVSILSEDDLVRNEMYKGNQRRKELERTVGNYGEYLKSLEMRAVIEPFESLYMGRIAQLTNKSNQFNLTTRRYTPSELEELAGNAEYLTLYGKLRDRFGENGVVSAVIGRREEEMCRIELWLMSCRVLKRDMECAMMDALVKRCQACGIRELRGYYFPTAKNGMVREFYKEQEFEKIGEDERGNTEWRYRIPDVYKERNQYIQIEERL